MTLVRVFWDYLRYNEAMFGTAPRRERFQYPWGLFQRRYSRIEGLETGDKYRFINQGFLNRFNEFNNHLYKEAKMKKLRCVIMRGGTSKGVFFHENELPQDIGERTQLLLRVFGSPDKRQIDGLGGADILTSKVVIIGPPSRSDAQVDYVFGQVGITEPVIDFGVICGNLSSAVGPFAIDEGLIRAKEPKTSVSIFCAKVNRYLTADIEVKNGKAVYEGNFSIDGVPGTGSRISLDYSDTAGLITGHLLPTGNKKDILEIKGLGKIEVSIIDTSTVAVFVRASDLGLKGPESPKEIEGNKDLMSILEEIVQKPVPWVNFVSGIMMKAEEADLLSKLYTPGAMHKAYPGTGCITTGVAAKMKDTIVNELLSQEQKKKDKLMIGHFSGLMPVEIRAREEGGTFKLEKAVMYRTARRIMEGHVYV
jgi:2-methylaconitate cis-trans-isomerase PrpF